MKLVSLMMLAMLVAAPLPAQPAEQQPSEAEVVAANCKARRFETTIQIPTKTGTRPSKVTICGKVGQSDADWVSTLKDAVAKVEANSRMPAEVKSQIVTALQAQIGEVATVAPPAASAPLLGSTELPPVGPSGPSAEYSSLPPLPPPVAAPPVPAPVTGATATLPPVSARPRPQPVAAPIVPPRLTMSCRSEIDPDGPCFELRRTTALNLRAQEALAAGAALRFSLRGEQRAEVALQPMRKGQTQRVSLPRALCAGEVGGMTDIDVVVRTPGSSAPRVASRLGTLRLRC